MSLEAAYTEATTLDPESQPMSPEAEMDGGDIWFDAISYADGNSVPATPEGMVIDDTTVNDLSRRTEV